MSTGHKKVFVPLNEKYMLTVSEAAVYFNIGTKLMRRLAEDNKGVFAILMGNRYLILRERFEKYILETLLTEKEDEDC